MGISWNWMVEGISRLGSGVEVEGSSLLIMPCQRRHAHSLNTASCQKSDIHSLASARSCFEPPRSSVLPFKYRINCAPPHDATTSPSSLNSGKNFSFMRSG
jgi:hypothetical protein